MTPEYILRKSLCREPHCASRENWQDRAHSEIEYMQYACGYAEPGYDNPEKGILFANWNYFPRGLGGILERYGYAIEWSDEWALCDGCGAALRTSPNCYSWQPSYISSPDSGEYVCMDCLTEDDIEQFEDQPTTAINLDKVDLTKFGYQEIKCGYESGWFPGQTADPKVIYDEMVAHGHKRLLFQINEMSQFYLKFCVWEKVA